MTSRTPPAYMPSPRRQHGDLPTCCAPGCPLIAAPGSSQCHTHAMRDRLGATIVRRGGRGRLRTGGVPRVARAWREPAIEWCDVCDTTHATRDVDEAIACSRDASDDTPYGDGCPIADMQAIDEEWALEEWMATAEATVDVAPDDVTAMFAEWWVTTQGIGEA